MEAKKKNKTNLRQICAKRQLQDHYGLWLVSHLKLRYGGVLTKGLSNKAKKALLNLFGSDPPREM